MLIPADPFDDRGAADAKKKEKGVDPEMTRNGREMTKENKNDFLLIRCGSLPAPPHEPRFVVNYSPLLCGLLLVQLAHQGVTRYSLFISNVPGQSILLFIH